MPDLSAPSSSTVAPAAGPSPERQTIQVTGEQGIDEAAALHARLQALLATGSDVVLDLSQAEHISGAVMQAVLACDRWAAGAGRSLHITGVPSRIQQAFAVMGLTEWLESATNKRE